MPSRVRRIRARPKSARAAAAHKPELTPVELLEKYRQQITAGVIALAVAVLILVAYSIHAGRVEEDALAQLEEARRVENAQTRIGILTNLLDRHPRGPRSVEVRYMLGNAYYDAEEFDRAKEIFGQLLDKYPKSYFAPMSEEALGYIAEAENDLRAAADHIRRVTEQYSTSFVARRAYIHLGSLYEKLGENDKAVEAYESLISRYPASEYAGQAADRLAELRPADPQAVAADTSDQPES